MPVTRDNTTEERDLACVMEVRKHVMGRRVRVDAEDGGEARRSEATFGDEDAVLLGKVVCRVLVLGIL
jgi:hypothetical protein